MPDLLDFAGIGGSMLGGPIVGSLMKVGGSLLSDWLNKKNSDSSIQRRVADAKKAGINPLTALGANVYNPPAVQVGGALGDMGQDISRAATANKAGGASAIAEKMAQQQLEHGQLQNDILRAQLATMRDSQTKAPPLEGKVKDTGTDIIIGGQRVPTNRGFSDVQEWQNRYGDFWGDVIGGPLTIGADVKRNLLDPASERFEARRRAWHNQSTFEDRWRGYDDRPSMFYRY